MQRSLVLLAFVALIFASSADARRLWQFPSLGGAAATSPAAVTGSSATGTGPATSTGPVAATGAATGAGAATGPATTPTSPTTPAVGATAATGADSTAAAGAGPATAAGDIPVPGAAGAAGPAGGAATTAPATTAPASTVGIAAVAPAQNGVAPAATTGAAATTPVTGDVPVAGAATTAPTTATATTTADNGAAASDATAAPGATAASDATATGVAGRPAAATATATGTPTRPGAAVAAAGATQGVAAGATGAATATAATADDAVAAEGDAAEAPAPTGPVVMRPGVYVIADPPPPPKVRPVAAAANGTVGGLAGRNATVGPPMPTPGKNLMVVMTVMGQQAKDIYKNQKSLKQQVADAAGVGSDQVLFFNQTTNQDPKTGVTAMSLILNVDCASTAQCAQAGSKLYNSSSQTRLTDALARNSISMLPGTFQIYGVQQMGRYKGNETLYENKALTSIKPKTADTDLDYNATLARVFAGMQDDEPGAKPAKGAKGKRKDDPFGALPGDIPLAGTPGLFGNFSIPMDNLPQATFGGMSNASLLPNTIAPLPADLPGLANATEPLQPAAKARSSAGGYIAGVLPLLAAAAAVMVL